MWELLGIAALTLLIFGVVAAVVEPFRPTAVTPLA